MTSPLLDPSDPYSLLRIGEAWRNRPGLTSLLITFVACVLLMLLGARSGSFGVMLITVPITLLVAYAGLSAAGSQFMDQAAGRPITPVGVALLGSPMIVLRSIGLTLILVLAVLAFMLVATVVYYLCKIPALGAVLYALALPALSFVYAALVVVLLVIGLIAVAGLWQGHGLKAALSQGWAVAAQRPSQALLGMLLLFFASAVVSFVVGGFVFAGFGVNAGLSAAILGREIGGGLGGLMGSMTGGGRFGGGGAGAGALAVAGLIGTGLVFAVTNAFFWAIFLLGCSLTYLKLTQGLDTAATQAAMDAAIAKTKEKAQQAATEARRRAQEAQAAAAQRMEQARSSHAARNAPGEPAQPAQPAQPTQPAEPVASGTRVTPPVAAVAPIAPIATAATAIAPAAAAPAPCPACHAPVTAQDAFCGACGHKLR